MKKAVLIAIFLALYILISVNFVRAQRGCCSHHGGVCGCQCCDGSALSTKCSPHYPSCNESSKDSKILIDEIISQKNKAIERAEVLKHELYLVKRVVDGDTLLLSNGERVRLIGVDTPETVHPKKPVERFGKEASVFTKKLCEGKIVRLEYDQNKRDKYKRLLAYVYLKDGTFVNAEIVKQGYGYAYTRFPFKYLEEFREYEKEAREKKQGLWASH